MRKIIYTMIVMLAILAIPITVFADYSGSTKTNEANVEILPSPVTPLSVELDGNFQPQAFAASGFMFYNAIRTLSLFDLSGKWDGWDLTAEATVLQNEDYKFPRGSLSLIEPTSISSLNETNLELPEISIEDKVIIDDGQVLVANARDGVGMGAFEIAFDNGSLALAVADDISYEEKPESGTYNTTVSWHLVSSDGEMRTLRSDDYELDVDTDILYEGKEIIIDEDNIVDIDEDNIVDEEVPSAEDAKEEESKIETIEEKEDGIELVGTSTNIFNYLLAGALLVVLGTTAYFVRRKQ